MKLRLDDNRMSDNFFEDTRILGIACTLKNYHFCWHVDRLLQIGFQTSVDLQIPMEKNRRSYSFTVYEYIHQIEQKEHFLYSNKHEGNNKLYRKFSFKDFSEAFAFMTRVAILSEKADHHPTWTNTWSTVEIWLSTHDAGNMVTNKDKSLASKIDELI